jgi:hypothetical protein
MNILETEYQEYVNRCAGNNSNQEEISSLDEWCEEQLTVLNFYSENEGKDNGYFFLHPAPEDVRMRRIQLYDEIMAYKNSK